MLSNVMFSYSPAPYHQLSTFDCWISHLMMNRSVIKILFWGHWQCWWTWNYMSISMLSTRYVVSNAAITIISLVNELAQNESVLRGQLINRSGITAHYWISLGVHLTNHIAWLSLAHFFLIQVLFFLYYSSGSLSLDSDSKEELSSRHVPQLEACLQCGSNNVHHS